ncbi:YncE family protein [Patulibacter sp. NPDC049589]|uniref:YncE family protein n=1 Tax=Patulibacter sp. NPDC049589 TaxID=3154731 RepID=UPI003438C034
MILSSPRRSVSTATPASRADRRRSRTASSAGRRGATALAVVALTAVPAAALAPAASAAAPAGATAAAPAAAPTLTVASSLGAPAVGLPATVTGAGFTAGSAVTLTFDGAPISTSAPVAADDTGAFTATIQVPAGIPVGPHALVATDAAGVTATSSRIYVFAAQTPIFGAERFTVAQQPLNTGLYQARYSLRRDALWVSSTEFKDDDTTPSKLELVDRRTLKVRRTIDVSADGGQTAFGVGVDDRHDTVWATNTLEGQATVWSQSTGRRLATLDGVDHARDIAIDPVRERAYVSAYGGNQVAVFDTKRLTRVATIDTGADSGPTSIALDVARGRLYVAALDENAVLAIDTRRNAIADRWPTGQRDVTGLGVDPIRNRVYATGTASGDVVQLDGRTGKVRWTRATGGGALSVTPDPITGRVFAANRLERSTTVLDPKDGKILANLDVGPNPNNVTLVGGTAFVVNKGEPTEAGHDTITKIAPGTVGRR